MLHHAALEPVYIFFDTATYDEIERDEKVAFLWTKHISDVEGDFGGPIGPHRRHDGSSHWLLHPQWGRNHLLLHPVVFLLKLRSCSHFQVLHGSQGTQSCASVCCRQEIWKQSQKETKLGWDKPFVLMSLYSSLDKSKKPNFLFWKYEIERECQYYPWSKSRKIIKIWKLDFFKSKEGALFN